MNDFNNDDDNTLGDTYTRRQNLDWSFWRTQNEKT